MFIGNVTATQVSTQVWTAASRTLTADPATDAGAATLVWTHATRTLTADPYTDAGGATIDWTHATRTLTADPYTDAGGATIDWTHATRTLTDYGLPTTSETSSDVSVTAGNGVKGSYTQVAASTSAQTKSLIITMHSGAGGQTYNVDISTGAAGSEVVLIGNLVYSIATAVGISSLVFIFPIKIASGTRIAARAQSSVANSFNLSIVFLE